MRKGINFSVSFLGREIHFTASGNPSINYAFSGVAWGPCAIAYPEARSYGVYTSVNTSSVVDLTQESEEYSQVWDNETLSMRWVGTYCIYIEALDENDELYVYLDECFPIDQSSSLITVVAAGAVECVYLTDFDASASSTSGAASFSSLYSPQLVSASVNLAEADTQAAALARCVGSVTAPWSAWASHESTNMYDGLAIGRSHSYSFLGTPSTLPEGLKNVMDCQTPQIAGGSVWFAPIAAGYRLVARNWSCEQPSAVTAKLDLVTREKNFWGVSSVRPVNDEARLITTENSVSTVVTYEDELSGGALVGKIPKGYASAEDENPLDPSSWMSEELKASSVLAAGFSESLDYAEGGIRFHVNSLFYSNPSAEARQTFIEIEDPEPGWVLRIKSRRAVSSGVPTVDYVDMTSSFQFGRNLVGPIYFHGMYQGYSSTISTELFSVMQMTPANVVEQAWVVKVTRPNSSVAFDPSTTSSGKASHDWESLRGGLRILFKSKSLRRGFVNPSFPAGNLYATQVSEYNNVVQKAFASDGLGGHMPVPSGAYMRAHRRKITRTRAGKSSIALNTITLSDPGDPVTKDLEDFNESGVLSSGVRILQSDGFMCFVKLGRQRHPPALCKVRPEASRPDWDPEISRVTVTLPLTSVDVGGGNIDWISEPQWTMHDDPDTYISIEGICFDVTWGT